MKNKLMTLIVILVLACALFLYGSMIKSGQQEIHVIKSPKYSSIPLPYTQFETLDRKKIDLNMLDAEIILLNFWASWCTPCLHEFPSMIELVKSYNGKIVLLAVSVDTDKKAMERVINKIEGFDSYNKNFVYWIWDQGKEISVKTFNTHRIPETLLIDQKRQIVDKIFGANDWQSIKVRSKINHMLSIKDTKNNK